MTKESQATVVADFARGIANRILEKGIIWSSKEDWWWYLSQLAAKVNELEAAMVAKEEVTDLARDVAIFAMIISDLQINHIKPAAKKKVDKKKKIAAKKVAAKKVLVTKTSAKKKSIL